ncbi:MAG: LacI family transcriptional regulator [Clostridiaceae bacterium]|nr:LacI family transcriptional regulator [Clostridiaceae bacterium]
MIDAVNENVAMGGNNSKPRLKDVAQVCGVSISTVSRVLNDHPAISVDTKQRVLAAVEAIGYRAPRPQPNAPGDVAAMIVPELQSVYYAKMADLVSKEFCRKGFRTVISASNFCEDSLFDLLRLYIALRVSCLIVMIDANETITEASLALVSDSGLPTCFISAQQELEIPFDCIQIDEKYGVNLAVQHLVRCGYKRLALIGDVQTPNNYHYFVESLRAHGLNVDEERMVMTRARGEVGGYRAAHKLLSKEGQRPDAIYACYDQLAIGAMNAIYEYGLKIPNDIALMGYDNIEIARFVGGGLTTISNPYEDMVRIAVRILQNRLDQRDAATQRIMLLPKLIERNTTGIPNKTRIEAGLP